MSDEPTAWEDINPPMALAPRHERPSPYLAPASTEDFRNELTACLALVAPAGMTEEAKRDWLAVAWGTVGHLPADLLKLGCDAARKTADHPAKIVPAIIAETEKRLQGRKEIFNRIDQYEPSYRTHIADRDRRNFTAADWAELNEYLESMGSKVRYGSDGKKRSA